MPSHQHGAELPGDSPGYSRQFLTCGVCGWVHYVMTTDEKATNDQFMTRYALSEQEQLIYESAFRQCLRCESPVHEFRAADAHDLARAEGHLVTPILVTAEDPL